jgi:Protein of unknown function (DUF3348)
MTRALPRAHINRSPLVRFLTENALMDAARVGAGDDVGPKLGDWLNFRQAIALHGVLNPDTPLEPMPAHQRRTTVMTSAALSRHVDKVRAQLAQSIEQGAPAGSGLARIEMPPAELDEPIDAKTAFEPYRRFYAAHQRQMENTLQTLRAQVRGQLNKSSGNLQQLAALDAAFESILSEREAMLLGKVVKLHEKRFAQALKRHIQQQTDALTAGEPATAVHPTAWLMPLRQAMRTALMAELDTRLQPTLGLLEAFAQENQETPPQQ